MLPDTLISTRTIEPLTTALSLAASIHTMPHAQNPLHGLQSQGFLVCRCGCCVQPCEEPCRTLGTAGPTSLEVQGPILCRHSQVLFAPLFQEGRVWPFVTEALSKGPLSAGSHQHQSHCDATHPCPDTHTIPCQYSYSALLGGSSSLQSSAAEADKDANGGEGDPQVLGQPW